MNLMRRLFAVLLLASICGCEQYELDQRIMAPCTERPTVNLPRALRQRNWGARYGGSCPHASMVSLFRWQNKPKLAAWWRTHNIGGEWSDGKSMAAKLNRAGVRFAYTAGKNDVKFLEWACNTRRGCCVSVHGGHHMVCLVHLDSKWAGLLDNNDTRQIIWVPRKTFLAEWFASESWALTPVYSPVPPLPHK